MARILQLALFLLLSSAAKADKDREFNMHDYLQGRHVYQRQCIECHGRTGRGDGPWSEDLTDRPRNFRVGVFKFRTTPMGFLPTDDDLHRTIRSGVSGTAMPAFKKLSDRDVDALIAYIQGLSKRWDNDDLYTKPMEIPDLPKWMFKAEERAQHIENAKPLFAQLCASCHGPEGKGDGPAAAEGLVDVWENKIKPADLTKEHHKSGDSSKDLFRTIALGLDGTPMVGFSPALKQEQIWGLVAFVRDSEQER